MKLLEVGNLGGQLAGFGFFFLGAGIVIIMVSVFVILVLGIMSAANTGKKYNFKAPLIGVLVGILTFIVGGCICGFSL